MPYVRDCGDHGGKRKARRVGICMGFSCIVLLVLTLVIVCLFRLPPSKPDVVLRGSTVLTLNVSEPNLVTASFQVRISFHNPNRFVGIYLDGLGVYVTFGREPITSPTAIPSAYVYHGEVTVWSLFLVGHAVPVAQETFVKFGGDGFAFTVQAEGDIRRKMGILTTGSSHIKIECPTLSLGRCSSN